MKSKAHGSVAFNRGQFKAATNVLMVIRRPDLGAEAAAGQPVLIAANEAEGDEVMLAIWDDGSVTALHGHVDLGTGLRTALTQIVAEELDVQPESIELIMGNTASVPNQGATIASASIQFHSQTLRAAAAQARACLVERAANLLGLHQASLTVESGYVSCSDAADMGMHYGEIVAGARSELHLDEGFPTKSWQEHKLVGTSLPRIDIPAKVSGGLIYVHDVRLPGMLHGRVIRPPYAGADHGDFFGNTLIAVNQQSISHIPGHAKVVAIRDFVGVVAEREEHAEQAMRELHVSWKPVPDIPVVNDVQDALMKNPSTTRVLIDEGDVDAALHAAAVALERTYVWPYQLHASIGPSCAVAEWAPLDDPSLSVRVWSGTQNPHVLRADLATLIDVDELAIDVVRLEASGCYGRNCADDVAADAVLLSRATGKPVRVQLTRAQEHMWEPKGTGQLMSVRGGMTADGRLAAYDFETSYPSNGSPILALLLTGKVAAKAQAFEMGDRTARPPYQYDNVRVAVHDMAPIVRASWLRAVSALPNAFAHECFIDELAAESGIDPVAFRLQHLPDVRGAELLRITAEKADWIIGQKHAPPQSNRNDDDIAYGRGVAYARHAHSKWPGVAAAWAVWITDVEVSRSTGEVAVTRVVVGSDAGRLINEAGAEHQIEGNVIQTVSRSLKERVTFAPAENGAVTRPGKPQAGVVTSREWGTYPILRFPEVPVIQVFNMPRPAEPSLGLGESSSIPGTAAIANAIFDAVGIRLRQPPFTPETVLAALGHSVVMSEKRRAAPSPAVAQPGKFALFQRNWWLSAGSLLTAGIGITLSILGMRPEIAPVNLASSAIYNSELVDRGRILAGLGNCVACHTAVGGQLNAGGKAMDTPFGTLHTTNLTPDPETGLGRWSFSAFQRAMREGISRDGRHLYPAFPYTAFATLSDEDLQALYGYFMSLPPVKSKTPEAKMRAPFGSRSLLAGWKALYNTAPVFSPDPVKSVEWNRGAYLVNGLGHCSACHSPRNVLGAELGGTSFLSGGVVRGWDAPALTAASTSAVPWSKSEFYDYLRSGHTRWHGIAGGPMADVVQQLSTVPDADIHAMAEYLASFNDAAVQDHAAIADATIERAARNQATLLGPAQRLFDGSCAACHHEQAGPKLIGVNTPLALSTTMTADSPDNLLHTILNGIQQPASPSLGFMPPFKQALDDAQIVDLVRYMRARFAPETPAWGNLDSRLKAARAAAH